MIMSAVFFDRSRWLINGERTPAIPPVFRLIWEGSEQSVWRRVNMRTCVFERTVFVLASGLEVREYYWGRKEALKGKEKEKQWMDK